MSRDLFVALMDHNDLPRPLPEHRFHKTRKWRFDFAWPQHKLALEVDGGVWTQGRHTRGAGFLKDAEKFNAAACMGWRVLRVTPKTLATLDTVALIRAALTETEDDRDR